MSEMTEKPPKNEKTDFFKLIRRDSLMMNSYLHGINHWRTVERNGVYLCQFNEADEKVVRYFAYFHDCMRENEGHDKNHGPRAAKYIKRIREHIDLSDEQINLLRVACQTHTEGRNAPNITVGTCWDADRLDLRRVNVIPHSDYMTSQEAKRIASASDYRALYEFTFASLYLKMAEE